MLDINGTNICMMCPKKNDNSVENQIRNLIIQLKTRIGDNKSISGSISNESGHYIWGNNFRCIYGLSYCAWCDRSHVAALQNEAERCMDKYISETDCHDYKEILVYMQGYFPQIYNEFERRVRLKMKKQEN